MVDFTLSSNEIPAILRSTNPVIILERRDHFIKLVFKLLILIHTTVELNCLINMYGPALDIETHFLLKNHEVILVAEITAPPPTSPSRRWHPDCCEVAKVIHLDQL